MTLKWTKKGPGATINDQREVPLASWNRECTRMADRIAADQCEGEVSVIDDTGKVMRRITIRRCVEFLQEEA